MSKLNVFSNCQSSSESPALAPKRWSSGTSLTISGTEKPSAFPGSISASETFTASSMAFAKSLRNGVAGADSLSLSKRRCKSSCVDSEGSFGITLMNHVSIKLWFNVNPGLKHQQAVWLGVPFMNLNVTIWRVPPQLINNGLLIRSWQYLSWCGEFLYVWWYPIIYFLSGFYDSPNKVLFGNNLDFPRFLTHEAVFRVKNPNKGSTHRGFIIKGPGPLRHSSLIRSLFQVRADCQRQSQPVSKTQNAP